LDRLGIGRRIRYWRERRGIPRALFAELIGRSKSWVEMAETGQRAPYRIDDLAHIATALRIDLGALLCEPIPEQAGDQQQQLLGMLRDAFQGNDPRQGLAEVARRLAVVDADDELVLVIDARGGWRIVKRRDLGKYGATLAFSMTVGPLLGPERSAELAASLETGRLSMRGVTALQGIVAGYRRLDDEIGSANLRPLVLHNLSVVGGLGRAGQDEPVTLALSGVHAELAQLAGWVSFDMGDVDAARGHYATALRAANKAGDDAMAAHTLGWMSYLATSDGKPQEGVRLAEVGVDRAARTPSRTLRASVARMKGRAHALAGEAQACAQAFGRAEVELAEADRSDDPEFIYCFDQAVLLAHQGMASVALGRPELARSVLERSLATLNPTWVRDRSLHLTWLAGSLVQAGEVPQACRVAIQAAELLERASSQRTAAVLRELHGQLRPWWSHQDVQALGDRLLTLS
jgi:transcriptional regulator with XRE-family HTH domain/tetratricopeptide (TPR) repeat protein